MSLPKICFFSPPFLITIIWWACVCLPSVSRPRHTFECCNTSKQRRSRNKKNLKKIKNWMSRIWLLHPLIVDTGSRPMFGLNIESEHQNNWYNQSLSFYRHVYKHTNAGLPTHPPFRGVDWSDQWFVREDHWKGHGNVQWCTVERFYFLMLFYTSWKTKRKIMYMHVTYFSLVFIWITRSVWLLNKNKRGFTRYSTS